MEILRVFGFDPTTGEQIRLGESSPTVLIQATKITLAETAPAFTPITGAGMIADASDDIKRNAEYLTLESKRAGEVCICALPGNIIPNMSGLTAGRVWLSQIVKGALQFMIPNIDGKWDVLLGTARNATTMIWNPRVRWKL